MLSSQRRLSTATTGPATQIGKTETSGVLLAVRTLSAPPSNESGRIASRVKAARADGNGLLPSCTRAEAGIATNSQTASSPACRQHRATPAIKCIVSMLVKLFLSDTSEPAPQRSPDGKTVKTHSANVNHATMKTVFLTVKLQANRPLPLARNSNRLYTNHKHVMVIRQQRIAGPCQGRSIKQ